MIPHDFPDIHSFPTRRSSDLWMQTLILKPDFAEAHYNLAHLWLMQGDFQRGWAEYERRWQRPDYPPRPFTQDRKSTRLNSSHQIISHAVLCLTINSANSIYIH